MSESAERIARALRDGELEVTRLAEGSAVVLHRRELRSCTLNPSGHLLLAAIAAGARDETDLADDLVMRYHVEREAALRDVSAFLAALNALL